MLDIPSHSNRDILNFTMLSYLRCYIIIMSTITLFLEAVLERQLLLDVMNVYTWTQLKVLKSTCALPHQLHIGK